MLVLEAVAQHNRNPVRVFSLDAEGELTPSDDVLIDGVAPPLARNAALSGDRPVKSWEVVFLPFDKTEGLTVSGTGTSPVLWLAHATAS